MHKPVLGLVHFLRRPDRQQLGRGRLSFQILASDCVTRTLWCYHNYIDIFRWDDLTVMDIKAVCKCKCGTVLEIWSNIVLVE